jgi:peptidyl-tRNA hydrolase, PTH1 family
MKLIVGLGNPGDRYQTTLHNAGFRAVDALHQRLGGGKWSSKFKSHFVQSVYHGVAFALMKPQTYMNLSGDALSACCHFYRLELDNVLVVSDDIDRPAGTLRYCLGGGHGGHNGLRSIIQQCGSDRFHRLKIGIGRPDGAADVAGYVLSDPNPDTRCRVERAIENSVQYLLGFIEGVPIQIAP